GTTTFSSIAMVAMVFCLCIGFAADAALDADDCYPEEVDPLVGNWKGRWSAEETVDPDIAAQVFALGGNKYQVRLVSKLFMRCPPIVFEAEASDGKIAFDEAGIKGEITPDSFTGARGRGKVSFEMEKFSHEPPTLGMTPPDNAIVLFDGTNFDQWQEPEGWELLDGGVMMVTPKGETLVSKQTFKSVQLHVEFRLPWMPKSRGQSRGNSGVFVQDVYEVQVLDTFGLEGYYDECGALYKVSAPRVNACLPPLEWQTYDITYHAPKYSEDGELLAFPRMTVLHNGILIQDDREMPQITAWKEEERLAPPPREPGHIKLQAHGNYVQFRNVFLVELTE
ncbi:MAG: DUF1080 domain-containing protein, partial [Candidatus Hydrogenedentota bacterium]